MKSGDKVVCIDSTPLPNFAPRDCALSEFQFPNGYIEEGAVYCVREVSANQKGMLGLQLVGREILFRGNEVQWSSDRFRSLSDCKKLAKQAAKHSAG